MANCAAMSASNRKKVTSAAEGCIELGNRHVTYILRRSPRRRSIALLIDERGLRVAAPFAAPQQAIDDLLREHATWVLRKVGDWEQKRPPLRSWIAGEQIMYVGQPLMLAVEPGVEAPQIAGSSLLVGPPALTPKSIEGRVRTWLKRQALNLYSHRCAEYSAQLGLSTPILRLSNARTRWGSCHASGRISMNWRLIQAPQEWIDYVAAHEVAHLRQMNHSAAFWRTVAMLVPDYAERRAALRRDASRYLLL
jgi:predicted metal-dependent hydrolase